MTCQACQTWNGVDDHRCRRCGRRLPATSARHTREPYPIAATALAYKTQEYEAPAALGDSAQLIEPQPAAPVEQGAQQVLFVAQNQSRVISFDQLTSPAERESIRARAAEVRRNNPVPSGRVEVSPRRPRKSEKNDSQAELDFFGKVDIAPAPRSPIQCGAPVAPATLRLNSALVDGVIILVGAVLFAVTLRVALGTIPLGKVALASYGVCLTAIVLAYKLLWCFANRDSFGMITTRLKLVNLDGNPATQARRFWRAFSSFLSIGAVGLGLIWTFVDADGLAWHDQISSTFPTFPEE